MPAPKRITLNVLPADIRHGVRGAPGSCPIARAVRRVFRGKGYRISVTGSGVALYRKPADGYGWEPFAHYPMKPEGIEFIKHFDAADEVKPITLKLTAESDDYNDL